MPGAGRLNKRLVIQTPNKKPGVVMLVADDTFSIFSAHEQLPC